VLNLFNQDTATGVHSTYQKAGTDGVSIDERAFYLGTQTVAARLGTIIKDPRFLMSNSFQAPILARFGVKFTF
jgi:hypothetical protein